MSTIGCNIKNNIKKSFVVIVLPVLLLFFVGPLTVYCSNAGDFSFGLSDFFFATGGVGVGLLITGTIVLSVFPKKINEILSVLAFYIGIMFYIQEMFMNVKLSEIDGSSMNWDEMKSYTLINSLIWLAALIVTLVLYIRLKDRFVKVIIYIAGFIAAMQVLVTGTLLYQAMDVTKQNKVNSQYGLIGDGQYELATNENVIVFVLDSYGSAQFDDGLKNNPELIAGLKDFTYYNNADSCYTGTFPSMTHMLTGVDLDMEISSPEYLEKAWTNDNTRGFYEDIHNAGYEIDLYSSGGKVVYGNTGNLNGLFDNAVAVIQNVDKRAVFFRMTKISIYKYVPYFIKPVFEVPTYMFYYVTNYIGHEDVNCSNNIYATRIREGLNISDTISKKITIQHLDGTHPPFGIDSNANYKDDASMQEVQEGLMCMLNEYFEELKKYDLYDNSTIIITADHGRWSVFEENDDPFVVYFVKKPHETHDEMMINWAPVSHDDFRATILSVIGTDYEAYGRSIFDISEDEDRERTMVHRDVDPSMPEVPGEACNVYHVFTYTGNRETLIDKANNEGPDEVHGIIGW